MIDTAGTICMAPRPPKKRGRRAPPPPPPPPGRGAAAPQDQRQCTSRSDRHRHHSAARGRRPPQVYRPVGGRHLRRRGRAGTQLQGDLFDLLQIADPPRPAEPARRTMCGVPVFHSAGCLSDELRRTAGGISHRSGNSDSSRRKRSADVPLKKKGIPPIMDKYFFYYLCSSAKQRETKRTKLHCAQKMKHTTLFRKHPAALHRRNGAVLRSLRRQRRDGGDRLAPLREQKRNAGTRRNGAAPCPPIPARFDRKYMVRHDRQPLQPAMEPLAIPPSPASTHRDASRDTPSDRR